MRSLRRSIASAVEAGLASEKHVPGKTVSDIDGSIAGNGKTAEYLIQRPRIGLSQAPVEVKPEG